MFFNYLKLIKGTVAIEKVMRGHLALEGSMGLQQNVERLFAVI